MKTVVKSLCWLALLAASSEAATFTASELADAGPDSLRQAMLYANAFPGDDTIEITANGTITLQSELPTITDNTTIIGPGPNLITISGSNAFRVFAVGSGTTNHFSGLTISDGKKAGYAPGKPYPAVFGYGSGISNAGLLELDNVVIRNCIADYNYGGGIYNEGIVRVETCVITNCGGVLTTGGNYQSGGGIYNNTNGTLKIMNGLISRCHAYGNGQGGSGIYNLGNLLVTNTVIENCAGTGLSDGGGILNRSNAVIHSCLVRGSYGFYGGGIKSYGTLAMTNTTISGNTANTYAAGLYLAGTNVLYGCTVYSNSGAFVGSGVLNLGNLRMYNCTVSRNRGDQYATGVGIADKVDFAAGTTYLNHCTVISNINTKGEILATNNFTAENSILGDCKGTLISGGHNLISNTNGCSVTGNTAGNILGIDAQLGPLQDNGGPTLTHAPLFTSPVIDQADAGGLLTDQRGFARPTNPLASDIGAVEIVLPTLQIALTGTNTVLISWPSPSTDFVLEENPDVATANWSDVGTTPSDNGTTKSVVAPVGNGNNFYRLRSQ